MRQVYFETFGCQMNVADTDRMELLLFHSGYRRTSQKEEADLILINTCSIREKAEHKIFSLLGCIKPLKKNNPDLMVGLTGCFAQQEGENLTKKFPYLDLILGPDTVEQVPQAVEAAKSDGPVVWTRFDSEKAYSIPIRNDERSVKSSAYVNIIKGCDKFCSFCIVPFTRGREKSREVEEICEEVRQRISQGAQEIILLGQNVNAYGKRDLEKPVAFHELLHRVANIPGVERLRFTTSHPKDFTEEIIAAYRDLKGLMNHLHLPVQCGSDRVLGAMRRGHTVADYLRIIDRLKEAVPNIAFSTDIIVGFPGETHAEFCRTLWLMDRVGFDNSYMFAYSPRPGTPATQLVDDVTETEKRIRLHETIELQKEITSRNGHRYMGQKVNVLIEEMTTRSGADFKGRSPHYWMVYGKMGKKRVQPGDQVEVRVEEAKGHVLMGSCVK